MEQSIRILHLEDNRDDVELVQWALDSYGIACQVDVARTRDGYAAALEQGGFDLILSDYSLPAYNGLSALRLAQEKAPGVPFVFVSGTLGEEAAIECVRGGATDYVLKHRLSRLAPVVARAISEAQERKKRTTAEDRLQDQERFLKAVLESLAEGIVACDSNGKLTLVNRAAQILHGLPAAALSLDQWSEHFELYEPDGKTRMKPASMPLRRVLQGEPVTNSELVIKPKNGSLSTVLVSGQAITDEEGQQLGAVVAMHDITERKRLEEQFRQAQKMEAIGQLASGIAHDFNNLLTAILGNGQLLKRRLGSDDPLREDVDEILRAGERAAGLTRQLLAFGRQQVLQPRALDLNQVVAEMGKMLERLIGKDIELQIVPGADLGRVKVDPGQVEQVIMNLVVNARDAMADGGRVTIETANVELDPTTNLERDELTPVPYVMLTIADTGCGMTSEIQSRIFEPFFTTKEVGKGTGLGLSTVHGIVKQSGGSIEVNSQPGQGTTFRIYLPRTEQTLAKTSSAKPRVTPSGSVETILVVDDEVPVRSIISRTLRLAGYHVMEAGTGEAALALCQEADMPDLVLTDVVMPKMSGYEFAKRLTVLRPEIEVIFMSGRPDMTHEAPIPGMVYLPKPFGSDALLERVRELLDERASRAA